MTAEKFAEIEAAIAAARGQMGDSRTAQLIDQNAAWGDIAQAARMDGLDELADEIDSAEAEWWEEEKSSILPEGVVAAIRHGWQFDGGEDPLDVVSVTAYTAAELAAIHREIGGCADLADALDAVAGDVVVYVVYTADGTLIWALQ